MIARVQVYTDKGAWNGPAMLSFQIGGDRLEQIYWTASPGGEIVDGENILTGLLITYSPIIARKKTIPTILGPT